MPCFYMTTHTTLSDAARALRRSCPVSLVTRHSPLVTAFLIATLPSSKVRPSHSKQRALEILITTLNQFLPRHLSPHRGSQGASHDSRISTHSSLITNHRHLIDSPGQIRIAATPS